MPGWATKRPWPAHSLDICQNSRLACLSAARRRHPGAWPHIHRQPPGQPRCRCHCWQHEPRPLPCRAPRSPVRGSGWRRQQQPLCPQGSDRSARELARQCHSGGSSGGQAQGARRRRRRRQSLCPQGQGSQGLGGVAQCCQGCECEEDGGPPPLEPLKVDCSWHDTRGGCSRSDSTAGAAVPQPGGAGPSKRPSH